MNAGPKKPYFSRRLENIPSEGLLFFGLFGLMYVEKELVPLGETTTTRRKRS